MNVIDAPCSQAEFGAMIGISQQAVSEHVRSGLLREGMTAARWLLDYCDHLREQAAGRAGTELAVASTELKREQRRTLQLKNDLLAKNTAPVEAMELILARLGRQLGVKFDSITPTLRKRRPDLPVEVYEIVDAVVAEARNAAAEVNFEADDEPLLASFLSEPLASSDDPRGDQAGAVESEDSGADLGVRLGG